MDDLMREHRICRQCSKPFSISREEQEWLKDRKLELYVRCSECRKKRREENARKR